MFSVNAIGTVSNRDAVGAQVRVRTRNFVQLKEIIAGSSFASTNSPWLTFGLQRLQRVNVEISWPSGLIEFFPGVKANQMVSLVEGAGLTREPSKGENRED